MFTESFSSLQKTAKRIYNNIFILVLFLVTNGNRKQTVKIVTDKISFNVQLMYLKNIVNEGSRNKKQFSEWKLI